VTGYNIVLLLSVYCTALLHLLYSCTFIVLLLYIYFTSLIHLLYCSCTFIVLPLYIYCTALVHLLYCYCTFIVLFLYTNYIAPVHLLYCSCTRNVVITWSALLSDANVGDGQTDDYKLFAHFMRRTHETLMSCPVRLILGVFKTNAFPPTLPGYSLCPKITFLNWRVGSFEIQRGIISFVPLCPTPSFPFTPSCLSSFICDSEM
jgi:hypothetical protein